jgi:hypothetical protein
MRSRADQIAAIKADQRFWRDLLTVLLAGCSAGQAASSAAPATAFPATEAAATPSPAVTPTPVPTATATREPSSAATRASEYLIAWQSDSFAEADIVVAVKNVGTWISLEPG